MGPFQHPFAFRRQAVETLAALDDRHTKLLFKLADAPGKCRLGDVAGLGGAGEVLLAGEGRQIGKLADVHGPG
jgi:hypothetical protein